MGGGGLVPPRPQSSRVAPVGPERHRVCRARAWFRRTRQYPPSWRSHAWGRSPGWPGSTTTGQRSAPDRSVWCASEIVPLLYFFTLYSIIYYVKKNTTDEDRCQGFLSRCTLL